MKLSIIIPAYKAQKSIGRCLESIFAGDYGCSDYEVIVVSDDEADQDWNELNQAIDSVVKGSTQTVKCIRNSRTKGVSGARNTGLDKATGEYVWFVDGDDTVRKDWQEFFENEVITNRSDVVIAGYDTLKNCVAENNHSLEDDRLLEIREFVSSYLQPLQMEWLLNPIWNKIFRKESIGTVRFQEGYSMGEDLFFVLSVLKVTKSVSLSSKIIYNYHLGENENSLCSDFHLDAIDMTFMTWQLERELLDNYGVDIQPNIRRFFAENKYSYECDLLTEHKGRLQDLNCIENKASEILFPESIEKIIDIVKLFSYFEYIRFRKFLSRMKHARKIA